jgi:hypothetical protein
MIYPCCALTFHRAIEATRGPNIRRIFFLLHRLLFIGVDHKSREGLEYVKLRADRRNGIGADFKALSTWMLSFNPFVVTEDLDLRLAG